MKNNLILHFPKLLSKLNTVNLNEKYCDHNMNILNINIIDNLTP